MEPAAKIFSSVRLFTSGLDFQQLKLKQVRVHSTQEKSPHTAHFSKKKVRIIKKKLTLMLKPKRSLTTAETADRMTTLVKL